MHALILAGGEGSRLMASGVQVPKALVAIDGQPQLVRLIAACRRVGATSITCALRDDLLSVAGERAEAAGADVIAVHTPDSLHTLDTALRAVPPGEVLCTLVDSVMPDRDWDAAHAAATRALRDAHAVVAVTPLVDDPTPLWVDVQHDGAVAGFGVAGSRPLVTGGVYWLSAAARAMVPEAVQNGASRLRQYLTYLVAHGARVHAVEVAQIVDVDTGSDLAAAVALMEQQ